ncbi:MULTISPECIES: GNAT family N-acetyltransferase [Bacillus]|uniref:GNAT family N-acetyltransferase n=1 Tax=Bacillus TaxID=1386 RepID=UPI0011C871E8|nr:MULTISPECIES: GNAT family N-acetyltransferase [Bacillus cereus group]MDA1544008.1 GNAT family N-acetyltransferase [Bacillus cereus group sp. TH253LC]MDA1630188.1 GNAT family N-acetyltransferase [Bacillus cereus group sp. TH172LC]MDA1838045.1 GNAT family N-acetyltransferase [Bacillus cereus group sp. BY17LC]MEC3468821.1 GNAT family N-acetyltransferase [Bacillus tropicus]TXR58376.1 GNAT family N-acetyltransferase [Bacillus sp. AR18-7]
MIQYKRCSEVNIDLVNEAFKDGFSDYIIKMEVSKEDFIKRFFGVEGNSLEHSFLALDGDMPVGVILGGIKDYENIKTMRCGTLAVHPNYRGVGVSQMLFELHKEEALQNECKQLFLEVIVGNDRAIRFYTKLGYEKVYDLSYYNLKDMTKIINKDCKGIEVKQLDFTSFKLEVQKWLHFHINWQNDMDYIEKTNHTFYGAYVDNDLKGSICINEQGKISFIFIDKEYRNRGIGSKLLQVARDELNLESLLISFPNNSLLEGFVKKTGFEKNSLAQYEMYVLL